MSEGLLAVCTYRDGVWCVAPRHLRPTTAVNYLSEAFLYNISFSASRFITKGQQSTRLQRVNKVIANNGSVLWVLVQVFLIADWLLSHLTFCG